MPAGATFTACVRTALCVEKPAVNSREQWDRIPTFEHVVFYARPVRTLPLRSCDRPRVQHVISCGCCIACRGTLMANHMNCASCAPRVALFVLAAFAAFAFCQGFSFTTQTFEPASRASDANLQTVRCNLHRFREAFRCRQPRSRKRLRTPTCDKQVCDLSCPPGATFTTQTFARVCSSSETRC